MPWITARRWVFFSLVGATTALGTLGMLGLVGSGGLRLLEVGLLLLFAATFGWISVAFWTGTVGFVLTVLRRDPVTLERIPTGHGAPPLNGDPPRGRTALVMPVYNEDPERVVAALRAMVGSLIESGHGHRFDAFLLSDTDDPEVARQEEALWSLWTGDRASEAASPDGGRTGEADRAKGTGGNGGAGGYGDSRIEALRSCELPGFGRAVYRRRVENTDQKAGNVADFCRRWGSDHDYMVILDADSLMTGSTLVSLARLMDRDPEAGLIQTVPIPVRQETLFGRLLQFAQALHAPLFAAGQSFWQAETANYWGHNAIVRVDPFMEHCTLPVLPGRPPLGGQILSHDFVEAALLRRGGWKVYLHPWIEGSWEGVPATVPAYATRDRRWAQGSLQHLRLLTEKGLRAVSRTHFTFGAMGYVSSLLWLLLLLGSTAYVILPDPGLGRLQLPGWLSEISGGSTSLFSLGGEGFPGVPSGMSEAVAPLASLLVVTAILLILPRLFALVLALWNRPRDFGGRVGLTTSFLLETLHSVVVAPVMMMYHTRFVSSILAGRNVPWTVQDRSGQAVSWKKAWRSAGWMTVIGIAWAGLTLYHSAVFFVWLTPIFFGLVVAVPLIRFTSRSEWGRRSRRWGLFLVPAETRPHNVLEESERVLRGESSMPSSRNAATKARRSVAATKERDRPGRSERVERALFDLQRGRPLLVTDSEEAEGYLLAAVEPLAGESLSFLDRHGSPGELRLVVTHHRARAMGLLPSTNGGAAGPAEATRPSRGWSFALGRNGSAPGPAHILHLSSALEPDLPLPVDLRPASGPESSGLDMVRMGRMLPALVSVIVRKTELAGLEGAVEEGRLLRITTEEIRGLTEGHRPEVVPISDSRVPLESTESARFLLFRERPGLQEQLAVIIGEKEEWPDPVPVRLHSACLTGDLFGSLRCDCGEQLRRSLEIFARRGGGVLLYLSQEGRSIGLANKLRAYALQQDGLDTVDANRALGFDDDERRYEVAVAMLRHLGIQRVELLTNNPEKVRALEAGGIQVLERTPLHGTLNRHNLPYVSAKVHRTGHWLAEMLGSRLSDGPGNAGRDDRAEP